MTQATNADNTDSTFLERLGKAGLTLLLAFADLHAVFILVYLLLRLLLGEGWWPVMFLSTFIHLLLLPAFITLPVMLITRQRWWRAALTAVPVIAFLWLFGGLFLPRARPAHACGVDPGCQQITAMTFNLGSGVARGEALTGAIRAADADIVALQEVIDTQQETLDDALADAYPYRVYFPQIVHGKGLLSRYPITHVEGPFTLHTQNTYLVVELDVEGHPLTVIVAHPPRPFFKGTRYIYHPGTDDDYRALADMATGGGPTILLGDFNNVDQSDNVRLLTRAGLTDTHRAAGFGLGGTFPAYPYPLPLVRIDFIFTSEHFLPLDAGPGPHGGSDHLPFVADLLWRLP